MPEPAPDKSGEELTQYEEEYLSRFEEQFVSMEPAQIDVDEQAEDHLRCYEYWLLQDEAVASRFAAEMARIKQRSDTIRGRLERRLEWHRSGLKRYHHFKGEKRLVMANATLSSTKGRERIEVTDMEALTAWAQQGGQLDVLRHSVTADKTAIQAYIKSTGEEPAGTEIVRGEDSFKVKF